MTADAVVRHTHLHVAERGVGLLACANAVLLICCGLLVFVALDSRRVTHKHTYSATIQDDDRQWMCRHNVTFRLSHEDDPTTIQYSIVQHSSPRAATFAQSPRTFDVFALDEHVFRVLLVDTDDAVEMQIRWYESAPTRSCEAGIDRSPCLNASSVEQLLAGHVEATIKMPSLNGTYVRTADGHVFDVAVLRDDAKSCLRSTAVHVDGDAPMDGTDVQEGPNVVWDECRSFDGSVYRRDADVRYVVRPVDDDASHSVDMVGSSQTLCYEASVFVSSLERDAPTVLVETTVTTLPLLRRDAILFTKWTSHQFDGVDRELAGKDVGGARRLQSSIGISGPWGLPPGVAFHPGGVVRAHYSFKSLRLFGRTYQLLLRATYTRPKDMRVEGWVRRAGSGRSTRVILYNTNFASGGPSPVFKKALWSAAITLFQFGPIALTFTPSVAARIDTLAFAAIDRLFVELAASLEIKAKVKVATPCLLMLRVELGVQVSGRVMNQMIRFGLYSQVAGVALWKAQVCAEVRHYAIGLRMQVRPLCKKCTGWLCNRCVTCLQAVVQRLSVSWAVGRMPGRTLASSCTSSSSSAPPSLPWPPPPVLQLPSPPPPNLTPCVDRLDNAACD